MCTSSIRSLEEALIQLQYALGDYHSCGKRDRVAGFSPLEASLCVLREAAMSAQVEINLLAGSPGITDVNHDQAIFQHAAG
jgi:hypothetical protein